MSSDEFRRPFLGDAPEPPEGTPSVVARAAWKMAWRAEQIAIGADTRSLALFENLGEMATKFTQEMMRRFDEVDTEVGAIGKRLDDIKPAIKTAEDNATAARTSSHDLQEDLEKMETILAEVKSKAVDSIRIKQLVVEEHQVLVTKQELERLQKKEADAATELKNIADERRNAKTTLRILTVSGIIVTLVGILATYAFTRATNPPTQQNSSQTPHP